MSRIQKQHVVDGRSLVWTTFAALVLTLFAALPPDIAGAAGGDNPPQCAQYAKNPNPRTKTASRTTYLHQMSDRCIPYGPINGSVPAGSVFILYYSDPRFTEWCYGYSWARSRKGWVLCNAL